MLRNIRYWFSQELVVFLNRFSGKMPRYLLVPICGELREKLTFIWWMGSQFCNMSLFHRFVSYTGKEYSQEVNGDQNNSSACPPNGRWRVEIWTWDLTKFSHIRWKLRVHLIPWVRANLLPWSLPVLSGLLYFFLWYL